MKPADMTLFGGNSVHRILDALAYELGEHHDVETKWLWNLSEPYTCGWKIDPDSLLAENLFKVFPKPGLSQFEEPEDFESLDVDAKFAWQMKRILESTGYQFAYESGLLRGLPLGVEPR